MFDTLTLDELHTLHARLFQEHYALHRRLVTADGTPIVSPLTDEWALTSAKASQISETCGAVYAEIQHREQETVIHASIANLLGDATGEASDA